MAAKVDDVVTREEFERFQRETNESILKLHAENLALVELVKQSHVLERQAMLAMKEMFEGFTAELQATLASHMNKPSEPIRIN